MDKSTPPTEADAHAAVSELLGKDVAAIVRFPTGNQHWVYDITLADTQKLVARLCRENGRQLMQSAAYWSDTLRPLGIPLPEILARGLDRHFPCLLLNRLPGHDLGQVLHKLDREQLALIATQLVAAQRGVDSLGPGQKYGFALTAASAPYASWSQALLHEINRNVEKAPKLGSRVNALVQRHHIALDEIKPLPFLHDVTTKNVIITEDGRFSGIVDVDDLCWGDPRFVKALTLVSMLANGFSRHYVDDWMAFAGEQQDDLFQLYVAIHAYGLYTETLSPLGNGNTIGHVPERIARLHTLIDEAVTV